MKLPNHHLFMMHIQSHRMRLEELVVFAEEMERILSEERERLSKRVNKVADKLGEGEAKELYLDDMSEEWTKLSEVFPQILRSSTFNRCVEDFEHMLLSLARVHRAQTKTGVDLGDLRGDGLRKAALYFEKVAGLPLPTATRHWALVMEAATIRNILVHNGGRVKAEDQKNVEQIVKRMAPHVTLTKGGTLGIAGTASATVVEAMKAILGDFQKVVRAHYAKAAPPATKP